MLYLNTSLKAGCPVGTQRGLPPQCALCARFLSLPGGDAELHLGGGLVVAAGGCWVKNSTADGSVIALKHLQPSNSIVWQTQVDLGQSWRSAVFWDVPFISNWHMGISHSSWPASTPCKVPALSQLMSSVPKRLKPQVVLVDGSHGCISLWKDPGWEDASHSRCWRKKLCDQCTIYHIDIHIDIDTDDTSTAIAFKI